MHKCRRLSPNALLLLTLGLLTACTSAPPLNAPPVVANCQPFPDLPPNLQEPPQATNATIDMQQASQQWAGIASTMPPKSPDSNVGTPSKKPTPQM